MKKALILTGIIFIAIILLVIGFFVYQTTLKPQTTQLQSQDQISGGNIYENKQYSYEIKYPENWEFREFPDTKTGAGFRPSSEPNDLYHEYIAVDWGARTSNYCNVSFDEYVKKYGAAVEIQNYESLNSISEITTDFGIKGYKTTWKYRTLQGEEKISLPITYFPSAENNCSVIRVSLSNANFMKEYDEMLSTFKLTSIKPFIFEGAYQFGEFTPPNQTWSYKLAISSNTGKWRLQLDIDGFQTLTRINATANNVGDSLDVIFDSYNYKPDEINPIINHNYYAKGDVLFTLTPRTTGLGIEWKKMQPQLEGNLNGSIFQKISN